MYICAVPGRNSTCSHTTWFTILRILSCYISVSYKSKQWSVISKQSWKITRVKQPDSLIHRLPFSGKLNKAAMATFSIGFTSSQVFVMLSVATYIMLAAAAPVGTDHSGCNRTIGQEIHNNLTNIVSYTLLLRAGATKTWVVRLLLHSPALSLVVV